MTNNLIELASVEQELTELRDRLKQSFAVLDSLAQIPAQFAALGQSYQQLQANLEQVKANKAELIQLETNVNQRLAAIETSIDVRWREFKGELGHLHDELGSADIHLSNYNAELAKQVSELREEVTQRLKHFWQEWTDDEATHIAISEIVDTKLNAELEDFIQKLEQAGFSPQYFERQQNLETELRLTQSSLRDTERQLQMIRNFTTITGLTVAITLGLTILQLLSQTG
jgi:DNA repair exonuclease SbcCD ATPase subunit